MEPEHSSNTDTKPEATQGHIEQPDIPNEPMLPERPNQPQMEVEVQPKQDVEAQHNAVQQEAEEGAEGEAEEGAQEGAEDNWTDATESNADNDDVWVLDDDIINAMDIDSDEDGEGDEEDEEDEKMKEEVDDLEEQFVTGGESQEDWKLGTHEKFCTSVAVAAGGKAVFSGGGDDRLLCFAAKEGKLQECYRLKHTETVSKIELSFDGKYVVSLTENQIYCTDIAELTSIKLDVESPVDVACHKQGGVLAAAHDYSVSIFNMKGLSLYATYNMDTPLTSLAFSENGKQVVAACENKLRIITPKTGDVLKVAGNEFHKEEISCLSTLGQLAVTGCIAGDVYVTSLVKGNILGRLESYKTSVNVIFLTEAHALIAPQGDGVHWMDVNKMKRVFHSPPDISASAIVRVNSVYNYAISDLKGDIHLLDYRTPTNIVASLKTGNSIHALTSSGSQLYAACEDGCVRVFDTAKLF